MSPSSLRPDDLERQKRAIAEGWDAIAEQWDAWTPVVDAWFAPGTTRLMRYLALRPGAHVLELAAGTGGFTRHLARAVGAKGHVTATDTGPHMLKLLARNMAAADLPNVSARRMDGEHPDVGPASFDAVACRQGFMFFADPLATLRRSAKLLRPGGSIALSAFSTPDRNACLVTPMTILNRWAHPDGVPPAPPDGPGPFSLGTPGRIESLLDRARLSSIEVTRVPCPLRMPSVEDLVRFYRDVIPDVVRDLPPDEQARAWAEVEAAVTPYAGLTGAGAPCELVVAAGRRPE